jgi:hypothetical protein
VRLDTECRECLVGVLSAVLCGWDGGQGEGEGKGDGAAEGLDRGVLGVLGSDLRGWFIILGSCEVLLE